MNISVNVIFLKIIAISKWSGYVLFEFNPLVMGHSLSIQYLSKNISLDNLNGKEFHIIDTVTI